MIIEYHRPESIQAALDLLSRTELRTYPLGGGTRLSHYQGEPIAVVDLQRLDLGKIEKYENTLRIGAMVKLQELAAYEETPETLKEILKHEANYNLRQTATSAGTLVSGDGKSLFLCAMLALDAVLVIEPGEKRISIEEWKTSEEISKRGSIITSILISVESILKYDFVGRSCQDVPLISVTTAIWPGVRKRIVIGGNFTPQIIDPIAGEFGEVEDEIDNACSHLSNNNLTLYFKEISKILYNRLSLG